MATAVNIEDIKNFPTSIDWGRTDSPRDGTSFAGACAIIPIKVDETNKIIEFVLLDSGDNNKSKDNIIRFLHQVELKLYTPKIIGFILTHFDKDHCGGMQRIVTDTDNVTELKKYFKNDLKFFARGYTDKGETKANSFIEFFFGSESNTDVLLLNEASKRIYQLTYGKILVRKWDAIINGLSNHLKVYFKKGVSVPTSAPHTFTLKEASEYTSDTKKDNLASLITVYFHKDYHMVFTGDSTLQLVLAFVKYLPRSPKVLNEIKNELGTPSNDLGKIYNDLFDYTIHETYNPNSKYGKAFTKYCGNSKFKLMELCHHGSVKNGLPSNRSNQIIMEHKVALKLKDIPTDTETLNYMALRAVINIIYSSSVENLFACSAGTKYHMNPDWYPHFNSFPLILSYPSHYDTDNYNYPKRLTATTFDYSYKPMGDPKIGDNFDKNLIKMGDNLTIFNFTELYYNYKFHPIVNSNIRNGTKPSATLSTISTIPTTTSTPKVISTSSNIETRSRKRKATTGPHLLSLNNSRPINFKINSDLHFTIEITDDDYLKGRVRSPTNISTIIVDITDIYGSVSKNTEFAYDFYVNSNYFHLNAENTLLYENIKTFLSSRFNITMYSSPEILFRMGVDKTEAIVTGVLFTNPDTLEVTRVLNFSEYQHQTFQDSKTVKYLEYTHQLTPVINFSYYVIINNGFAEGDFEIYSDTNGFTIHDIFQIPQFTNLKERIFGFTQLFSTATDVLETIENDIHIVNLCGSCKGTINRSNYLEFIAVDNLTSLTIGAEYRPPNNLLFSIVHLDNIQLAIEVENHQEEDVVHWDLSSLSVGGFFKPTSSLSIEVIIDLNIGEDAFPVHFYPLNLSLSDVHTHSMANLNINEIPSTPLTFHDITFLGDLSNIPVKTFSVYLQKNTLKFAGVHCLLDFPIRLELSNSIHLTDVVVEFEYLNKNISFASLGKESTNITAIFNFNTTIGNVETKIGQLSIAYEHISGDKNDVSASVTLENNTSLQTLIGYFVSNSENALSGCPINLNNVFISYVLLKVNLVTKSINSFHFDIYLTEPFTITSNLQITIQRFTLNYTQSSGFSISTIIKLNGDEIDLVLARNSIGSWIFSIDYVTLLDTSRVSNSVNDIVLMKDQNFIQSIFSQIALKRVHLQYDSGVNPIVSFYSEIDQTKLGVVYFESNSVRHVNVFFSVIYHVGDNSRNSNASLINELTSKLDIIGERFFGTADLQLSFLYTDLGTDSAILSSALSKDPLLHQFISSLFTIDSFASNQMGIVFRCRNTILKNVISKISGNQSEDDILFSIMKVDSTIKFIFAYECNIEICNTFKITKFELDSEIGDNNLSLSLQVKGQFKSRGVYNQTNSTLSGTLILTFAETGFSIGLALIADKWFQPLSINWLFLKKLHLGADVNITEGFLSRLVFDDDFCIISLEDQKAIETSTDPYSIINQYPKNTTIRVYFEIDARKQPTEFDFDLSIIPDHDFNLHVIFRDVCQYETDSELFKSINFQKLRLMGNNKQNQISFDAEVIFRVFDIQGHLKIQYHQGIDTSLLAMGKLTSISLFNGKIEIASFSKIQDDVIHDSNYRPDPNVKQTELDIIHSFEQLGSSLTERKSLHVPAALDFLDDRGPMFKFILKRNFLDFQISAGFKFLGSHGAIVASIISNEKIFISGDIPIGAFIQLGISANITKTSFRFSSTVHWGFSLTTPSISIGGVEIFKPINLSTEFNGTIEVSLDSTDAKFSIQLEFDLNDKIHISMPKFQISLSDIKNIISNIVHYITEHFKELVQSFLSGNSIVNFFTETLPNFFSDPGRSISYFAKELGHSPGEVKDWLIQKFGPEAVKGYLIDIFGLGEDAAGALVGFLKDKVVDPVINGIKDGYNATKDFIGGIFHFSLWSVEMGITGKIMYGVDGIYINKKAKATKHSITDQTIGILSNLVEFFFYNRLVIEESIICYLKPEYYEKIANMVSLHHKFTEQVRYLNLDNKSVLIKEVDTMLDIFEDIVELLTSITNELMVNCFGEDNKCNIKWFQDSTLPHYKNYFIHQILSFLKYTIVIYNKICPLFQLFDKFLTIFSETPVQILIDISKLNVLKHVHSCMLNPELGGNGTVFQKSTSEYYIILDSRVHAVNRTLLSQESINSSVLLVNTSIFDPDVSDDIEIGQTLEHSQIIQFSDSYYLLTNGSIRKIGLSLVPTFNTNLTNIQVKNNLDEYFESEPIDKDRSQLEGFSTGFSTSNPKNILFETGRKSWSLILLNSIVQVYDPQNSNNFYYLLFLSQDLIFKLDSSESIDQRTILNIREILSIALPKRNSRVLPVYKLPIDQIPSDISLRIKKTAYFIEKDRNHNYQSTISNININPLNSHIELFKFDTTKNEYFPSIDVSQSQPTIQSSQVTLTEISQLPTFYRESTFKMVNHSQDSSSNNTEQYFFVTNDFMFPLDFKVSSAAEFTPSNGIVHSNIVLKKDLLK